ncbi:translation initiation factor IF-2 [candidate division WWE3 bacterium CG10_big_fil_rev_8_21_14_0_10_32_10]|uniref:Translation initiation factor IF-2 n=1 Tax=candidate division WWE3 bacterium CG10_big_fil_rev_8_21_14_0_10_32_10 TaxID=1975090 RepID=A0A2H0RA82_UNCKA|nr:MAG: translation initiation factor IF-2 [candidate division WWE3 bacterium CG10_big_fil_rev_8_21_14_0_10_32_10]
MKRPPIVTVMGHVDHGKTTLLDSLRNTNVVVGESGGITQHVGASQIDYKGNKITFIDTPGHEAFSEMRSRGGKIADIVVLVVAADDGVQPQTKEAISHAKAAKIPVIVAINKMDLPDVNPAKIKSQLSDQGLVLEEFGGDVIGVEISATKKTNLNLLLDSILALSEMSDNNDSSKDPFEGFVLESLHNNKVGVLTNILVTNGVLNRGDEILVGGIHVAKIKAITDSFGKKVDFVKAGDPASILGLKEVVKPGDPIILYTGQDIENYKKVTILNRKSPFEQSGYLPVIIRADTQGTLEAILASLAKLEYEDRKVDVLLSGVGELKESDILLASVSHAIVISFKVSIPSVISDKCEKDGIIIREYEVIYNLIEEIDGALEGISEIEEEKVRGRAVIQKLYPLPSGDVVCGSLVTHGRLRVGDSVVIREDDELKTEVFKTKIKNLKKAKESVTTVGKNTECGVLLNSNNEKLREDLIIDVI